jgi:hypothetical protein
MSSSVADLKMQQSQETPNEYKGSTIYQQSYTQPVTFVAQQPTLQQTYRQQMPIIAQQPTKQDTYNQQAGRNNK